MENLIDQNFIAIDLETTGLDPEKDEIIEIAAAHFINSKIVKTYEQLIRPQKKIPKFITQLTGISNEDVKEAPAVEEVLDDFLDFIGDKVLIFHNSDFDTSFLQTSLLKNGRFHNLFNLDTIRLARTVQPFLNSYKLELVCNYFDIQLNDAHRALNDAIATGELFFAISQRWKTYSLETINELMNYSNFQGSLYRKYFQQIAKNYSQLETKKIEINPPMNHYEKKGETKNIRKLALNEFFKENGLFAQNIKNYEKRDSQITLSALIEDCFQQAQIGIFEAATGTGKSLAYLVPSILFSMNNKEKVVISTKTKALQDQLFYKDIPQCQDIVKDFSATLLKGKSNYFCLKRFFNYKQFILPKLKREQKLNLLPVFTFLEKTISGDMSEIHRADPVKYIQNNFCTDRHNCFPNSCQYENKCYWLSARKKAEKSNLIISNHSLIFSDLGSKKPFLRQCQYLVLDEAHHLEKIATSYLGNDLDYRDIKRTLDYLSLNKTKDQTLMQQLVKKIQANNLLSIENIAKIESLQKELILISKEYLIQIDRVFNFTHDFLKSTKQINSRFTTKYRMTEPFKDDHPLAAILLELKKFQAKISDVIKEIVELIGECKELADELNAIDEIEAQLGGYLEFFEQFYFHPQVNSVYWLEYNQKYDSMIMHDWPLSVDEMLQGGFFNRFDSTILISATLSINENFKYYKQKLGLQEEENVIEKIIPSEFDYHSQVLLAAPIFLPEPKAHDFNQQISELFIEIYNQQQRGSLVLFTSYQSMNAFQQEIKKKIDPGQILMQKSGVTPGKLIYEFKKNHDSILLGTDTFWEGIDVPGKALENLFITKLPFQVPNEPITEARIEKLKQENKDPFYHFSVPEAIIRLKQGTGRLIRNQTDQGIIIILDRRIERSSYGKYFKNSLFTDLKVFKDKETFIDAIHRWYNT